MIEELLEKLDKAIKRIDELEHKLAITEEKLAKTEEALFLTQDKLAQTEEKLKVAEEKLNQNSFNSHLPPSKDSRKVIKQALPKSNKKNGGQVGHKGNTLKMVSQPDYIVKLKPELSVCSCGKNLSEFEETISGKRQVFDLPIQKFDVTEYQTIQIKCSCGRCHVGNFPKNVQAPVQFGAGVQAASILLSTIGTPLNKIGFIFESLFGQKINDATILKMLKNKSLEAEYNNIYNQLSKESVLCVDESGFHVTQERTWCHTISSPNLTYLYASKKRGHQAFDEAPMLKDYQNWLVSDCYSSYNHLTKSRRVLCNAHICRELMGIIENDKREWAKEMLNLLYNAYNQTNKATELHPDYAALEEKFTKIIKMADEEEPKIIKTGKKGKHARTKGRNLLERLQKLKDSVLAFAKFIEVPFTNNLAERDFRPLKVKNKIAGYLKTPESLKTFLVNLSIFKTAVKSKLNPFCHIKNIICKPSVILT